MRYLLYVLIYFYFSFIAAQEKVYSNNDVNFTIGKRAYDEKNWSLATGYFDTYIEKETFNSVHPAREKKLMEAYLYAGYSSEMANRLEKTITYYEHGIQLARKLDKPAYLSLMLNNVGIQYQRIGRFQQAIDAHKESLKIDLKMEKLRSIGIDYSNIGDAYLQWGDYTKALENYEKSKEFHLTEGDMVKASYRDIGIGEVLLRWNQLDKALEVLEGARSTLLEKGYNPSGALMLIAEICSQRKDFAQAEEKMRKALEYDHRAGNDSKMASRLNDLGLLYHKQEKHDEAVSTYEEGLANARFRKNKDLTATILSNLGALFYNQGDYGRSLTLFEEAVSLKEELRKSAFGPIRREYLSSQIKTQCRLANSDS